MLALAGVAAMVLAVGGVAVAAAATSDSTPSPSTSAAPSPGSSGAPDRVPRGPHPFLAGTVVSASEGTITITDFQGFQRTIHTSSSTTYEDGLSATPAAGTRIFAVGTVDTDKTSLAATRVAKLPDKPEVEGRFPDGPGRGWPGGPGHRHYKDEGPSTSTSPDQSPPGGSEPPAPSPPSPTPSPSGTA